MDISPVLRSKLGWSEHEGIVFLKLAREPEDSTPDHIAWMCGMCSITILAGLLTVEAHELNDVFGGITGGSTRIEGV